VGSFRFPNKSKFNTFSEHTKVLWVQALLRRVRGVWNAGASWSFRHLSPGCLLFLAAPTFILMSLLVFLLCQLSRADNALAWPCCPPSSRTKAPLMQRVAHVSSKRVLRLFLPGAAKNRIRWVPSPGGETFVSLLFFYTAWKGKPGIRHAWREARRSREFRQLCAPCRRFQLTPRT